MHNWKKLAKADVKVDDFTQIVPNAARGTNEKLSHTLCAS